MTKRVPRTGETTARKLAALAFVGIGLSLGTPLPGAGPAPSPPGCKPMPPIELRLIPLDGVASPGVGRFALDVTPRFPAREIRVRWIRSTDRLGWVAGDSLGVRLAGAAPSERFQVSLRLPASGQEILHCQVQVVGENGQIWGRGIGLAVGPEAAQARGRLVSDDEGSQVLEFDAAPADRRVEGTR